VGPIKRIADRAGVLEECGAQAQDFTCQRYRYKDRVDKVERAKNRHEGEGAVEVEHVFASHETEVWVCESALPGIAEECEPTVCDVRAGEPVSGRKQLLGCGGRSVSQIREHSGSGCGAIPSLVNGKKSLAALASGVERLPSSLVQTFPNTRVIYRSRCVSGHLGGYSVRHGGLRFAKILGSSQEDCLIPLGLRETKGGIRMTKD